jgi:hypothetical protein
MTDTDGNGNINAADCNHEVETCPETDTPMTDVNDDGSINADDCTPPPAPTCPDGSPMTDTDGNGNINAADCNKADDTDTPITETEVAPTVVIGPITPSHVEDTPLVLGTALEALPEGTTVVAAEVAAAVEDQPRVLGVQIERPAPATAVAAAPLARTGASNGFLALLATLLLALGTALVRIGGRRPTAN